MPPLQQRTIATVGSGVMAEAMIAGLLRGQLVTPQQVVASHPRAERREALEREYGIRTVASNIEAVKGADVEIKKIDPAAATNPLLFPTADLVAKQHAFRALSEAENTQFSDAFKTLTGA